MKNLAGVRECDQTIRTELTQAGIEPHYTELGGGEVPAHEFGKLCGWTFRRAWYYWVASGPPLPFEYATPLHNLIGEEVRVEGHCGCPAPEEWYKLIGDYASHGAGTYHVDTQEGLDILAATLRKWQRDRR